MSIWNRFPYTNFHNLNLDWVIKTVKQVYEDTENLIDEVNDIFKVYVTKDDLTNTRKLDETGVFSGNWVDLSYTDLIAWLEMLGARIIYDIDNPDLVELIKPQSYAEFQKSIRENGAVSVGLYGDSIYAGFDGSGYVAETVDVVIQNTLRTHFNVSGLSVNNYSVQGRGTVSELPTWSTTMQGDVNDLIIINYGVNDVQGTVENPAINGATYLANLMQMILTAKSEGKLVVVDTPNYVLNDINKANGVNEFSEIARAVSKFCGVMCIDSNKWLGRLIASSPNYETYIPDGIHQSQECNYWHGRLIAHLLMYNTVQTLSVNDYSVCASPNWHTSGGLETVTYINNCKSGAYIAGEQVSFTVFVDESGVDLIASLFLFTGGSVINDVFVNGVNLGDVSFNDDDLGVYGASDVTIDLAKNCEIGAYFVSFIAGDSKNLALNYVKAIEGSRSVYVGGTNLIANKKIVLDNPIVRADYTGYNTFLSGEHASSYIDNLGVEVKATFGVNSGVIVYGYRPSGIAPVGNDPMGGLLVWLDGAGVLSCSESGTLGVYINTVQIGSVDLTGVEHVYNIECDGVGLVTIYVDGVLIGTYNQNKGIRGGELGLWRAGVGVIDVDYMKVYEV